MPRKLIIGSSLAALLALTSTGCGAKKGTDEGQVKKGLLTQPPATAETSAPASEKTPEVKAELATPEILAQVPVSSVMVIGVNKPEESLSQFIALATRLGAKLEEDAEFQKGREDFKSKLGVDILEPGLFEKLGINAKRGIALVIDAETTIKNAEVVEGAAATRVKQDPIIFLVASLSSGETFDKTIRAAITKDKPERRFEDVTVGEKDKLTLVFETKTEGESKTETIQTAFAQKGELLYVFLSDPITKPEDAAAGDPISDYKVTLTSYLQKTPTSITADANFNSVLKKIDPTGSAMAYVDFAKIASLMEAGSETTLYSTPKNKDEETKQEEDKKAAEQKKTDKAKEISDAKKVAEIAPQLGFSFVISTDKLSMKGSSLIGASAQEKIQKVIAPAAEAPAFATIFPEGTGFFYRLSLNFVATKELVFSLMPEDERAVAMTDYAKSKSEFGTATGLDLDTDVLGAFTGHTAFGADSADSFTKYAQSASVNPMAAALPRFMMVSQFVSADAGDKLLKKIEEAINKAAGTGILKTEEVGGDKIYSFAFPPFTAAWGRSGQTFVFGTDLAQVKTSFEHIKTPGTASFTDKLTPLAKSLATDKNANGITLGLGALLADIVNLPSTNPEDKEMLAKLSTVFDVLTIHSNYLENQANFEGELTLKQ